MSTNDTLRGLLAEIRLMVPLKYMQRIDAALAEPVSGGAAPFSKGFTTLETGNGQYRIVTTYQNRDDAWADYTALNGRAVAGQADSNDKFYAGLYFKASPMWKQLHDLAVSKGYDHVRYAIECAPVYKCDCMGARKVAIDLEGRTQPCECVEPANDSAPICDFCRRQGRDACTCKGGE